MAAKKTQHRKTFEERIADIDRGHRLVASEAATEAMRKGAIAATWHHHNYTADYDQCPEHTKRDGKCYAIRGNWAIEAGLMNKGAGFTDEITAPAEESMCMCFYTYDNNIRDLPEHMLTKKGKRYLASDIVSKSTRSNVMNQTKNSSVAGIATFIFGLISIFFLAPIFVPLAVLMGIIALLSGQFAWGCIGLLCAFIGFITSPILMGIFGLALIFSQSHPVQQKPQTFEAQPQFSNPQQQAVDAQAPQHPETMGENPDKPPTAPKTIQDSSSAPIETVKPQNESQPPRLVYSAPLTDFFIGGGDIQKNLVPFSSSGCFTVELHSKYKNKARRNMIETIRKQISSGELAVSPEKGDPDLLGDIVTTAFFDTQKKTVTFSGKQFYMDTSHAVIGTREIQETYPFDSPKYRTLGKVAEAIESRLQAPRAAPSNPYPQRQGEPRTRPTTAQIIQKLRSRDPSKSVAEKRVAPAQQPEREIIPPDQVKAIAGRAPENPSAELIKLKSDHAHLPGYSITYSLEGGDPLVTIDLSNLPGESGHTSKFAKELGMDVMQLETPSAVSSFTVAVVDSSRGSGLLALCSYVYENDTFGCGGWELYEPRR
ncbi:MAG: hypothetical protein ACLP3B_23170 [Syntrophobacteraceae bacterium]